MINFSINQFETKKSLRNYYLFYLKICGIFKIFLNFFFKKKKSEVLIEILITVAQKDFYKLSDCVESLRKNLLHPIKNIYIVAPNTNEINKISKELKVIFVDEKTILNKDELNINYTVNGKDRSFWLYQELLNFKAIQKLGTEKYILGFDSDTMLSKKQKFIFDKKVLFNVSDEYTQPYFDIAKKLLNLKQITNFSLTSHHILYDRDILEEMLGKIQKKYNLDWVKSIINECDFSKFSCHSEYETYGQYFFNFYRKDMILEYWFNKTEFKEIKKKNLTNFYYKTISRHHWTEEEK